MASYNKVVLMGNLGADPEIRTFDNGGKVASFRIATTERWKDKNTGEQKEQTDWHNIVVRSAGLAGVVENYVKKGSQVLIDGKLRYRSYEQNGEKKYITEVVVDNLTMIGKPQGQQNAGDNQPQQQQSTGQVYNATPMPLEDDLPF